VQPVENSNDVVRNEKIVAIYGAHINIIAPFIVQLEALDGEFPVEILNEIRAIFTHISRCSLAETDDVYQDNIVKAERHVKRAILDCHKYMCVAYDEHYRQFDRLYKNVDLSVVDNGDFLVDLCQKRKASVHLLQKAKQIELSSEDDSAIYSSYADAYNAYSDVYRLIEDSYSKLERAKRRASKKDIISVVSFIVGLVGLVGTVFSIVSFFI
jgi:Mg2+ and Co2+ transporter CorA